MSKSVPVLLMAMAISISISSSVSAAKSRKNWTLSSRQVIALFQKVDRCAHNGGGTYGRFNPRTFNYWATFRRNVNEYGEGSCNAREYEFSKSTKQGITRFFQFLKSDWGPGLCLKKTLTRQDFYFLGVLLNDPTNLAVYSVIYNGDINPEACTSHTFSVYRADGLSISFNFDYTD